MHLDDIWSFGPHWKKKKSGEQPLGRDHTPCLVEVIQTNIHLQIRKCPVVMNRDLLGPGTTALALDQSSLKMR